MKPTEAAALLTIAAAYDNRKPDADAARVWAITLDGLRFADCREAIVEYYRHSRDWLMPVDVIEGVRALRSARWTAFVRQQAHGDYLLPPAHMADDPAAEQRWIREITERVRDGEIISPDQLDERGELKPRDVESLGQLGQAMPRA